MKKSVLKGSVLIASMMALVAFAVPAMASAAVWGPVNTNGALDSLNTDTTIPALSAGWFCSNEHLGVHVRSPASNTLDVTGVSISGCSGTAGLKGCAVAQTVSALPWTIPALSTSNVQVSGYNATLTFSNGTGSCAWNGAVVNVTGTLTGGVWNAATHSVVYTSATGLTAKSGPTNLGSVSVTGTFKNPTQTLTLF